MASLGSQLADMGCARIVERGRTHVSTTSFGTVAYMPVRAAGAEHSVMMWGVWVSGPLMHACAHGLGTAM